MDAVKFEINQLMKCLDGRWKEYDGINKEKILLSICRDQFLILSNNKILERLCLYGYKKGFYKRTVFVLILKEVDNTMRKIRFNFVYKNQMTAALETLGKYFPLTDWNKPEHGSPSLDRYKSIHDVLREAINNNQTSIGIAIFPPVEEFLKLCLLDPMFPQLLSEVHAALEQQKLSIERPSDA